MVVGPLEPCAVLRQKCARCNGCDLIGTNSSRATTSPLQLFVVMDKTHFDQGQLEAYAWRNLRIVDYTLDDADLET